MRTEISVRSLTDFTGSTYLGANLYIHAHCVRSTQWSDFHIPRTDRPVRFSPGLHQYAHETPDYGRLIPTHRYSPSFTHR